MPLDTIPKPSDARATTERGMLRLLTCGSVDDGKSTLIGRMLWDTETVFRDQRDHVEDVSRRRGDERTNLALLTDGLRAEREQGITIDVAYRYFSTPRRKFIIADCPGHAQYTRNMVTGASTADLAVLLLDARHGVVEQTRRHAYIATLLGIRQLVVAVNKLDLVDWSRERFDEIVASFEPLRAVLPSCEVCFIPMSALRGGNVVQRAEETPWYDGPVLLEHLETVPVARDETARESRLPVQWVIRPQSDEHHDYRAYAGTVAAGSFRCGDEVLVLPRGQRSTVRAIDTPEGPADEANAPMAVALRLADDVDVSRGDCIVSTKGRPPHVGRDLVADVCWMTDQPLAPRARLAMKLGTSWVRVLVSEVVHAFDIHQLSPDESAAQLELNAIGRVRLRTSAPVVYDEYDAVRATGGFILVDEASNVTVGAGLLRAPDA